MALGLGVGEAAVGAAVLIIAAGVAYRYATRGGDVSAEAETAAGTLDFDASSDGEDDTSQFEIEEAGGTSLEKTTELAVLPDAVTEKEGLTDITGVGNTRAEALQEAGYETPEDVYFASNDALSNVPGIGDYTVDQIRSDIGSPGASGNGQP